MTIRRRDFLSRIAAGTAAVSMPAFLAGCGVVPATRPASMLPDNPFLDWFGVDRTVIARVMAVLTANGADTAELYFQHRRSTGLRMADGTPGAAQTELEQGVGLRVVIEGRTGYASTEDLRPPAMQAAARRAATQAAGAGSAGAGPAGGPGAVQHHDLRAPGNLYATALPWSEVGLDRKLPLLERVDRIARAAEPSVDGVSVHWSDSDERVLIATLDGRLLIDRRPMTQLSAQVTATRGGVTQSAYAGIAARADLHWYTEERIDRMAREAVERTLILFDARRPPVGELPVMLASGASGILLHEAIGHALEADFNLDGTSAYAGRLGMRVAGPSVTVVDQGTLPGERGALNYDDEGNASGRNVLIERGVLRSYLHDAVSARRYGVPPTGSGRRESYRYPPMPRMTCTFMEDGPHMRDELVAAVEHGIIAETYTNGRVRLGAGDYSFDVKNGWLVERGRITAPLRDLRIAGNGPATLAGIAMVANDGRLDGAGWTCGKHGQRVPVSQGMPSVLVPGMTVAATSPDFAAAPGVDGMP